MTKRTLIFIIVIGVSQICWAVEQAKIVKISGEVKVRRGVEEKWENAHVEMLLKPIDTILTGEQSEVVLELSDNRNFKLGSNAILDIMDLRKISEKELFLFLMSTKIGKITPRDEKTPIRVGNVSVVHGENKSISQQPMSDNLTWLQETNGAKALHQQHYYTNSVVKLHKILTKYTTIHDCGEIHYYLGNAFESLNKPGQAIDAYQSVIDRCQEQDCDNADALERVTQAKNAIERLKS